MKTEPKSLKRSVVINAVIFGTIMFAFYYFADKDPLNKSLSKAVVVSLLYGIGIGLVQAILNRKKRTDRP